MAYEQRIIVLACLAAVATATGCNNNDGGRGPGGSCESILAGDLVITEIMANPAGSPDTGNEWFEIFNATETAISLNGGALVYSKPDGDGQKQHEVDGLLIEAGAYAVVGGAVNDPDLLPGHVNYGYARDLGDFRQSDGRLVIACGDTIIDDALYVASAEGSSRIYTGERTPDATAADDLNFWCDSTTSFGTEQFATPGAANDVCEGVGSPTECVGDNGETRAVVPPTAGGVVISEIMPNPDASQDDTGEWFEIYFTQDADLNGLSLAKGDDEPILILDTECHHFTAGSYAVVARSVDSALNGGLPQVDGVFGFSLKNTDGDLRIGYGDETLDEVRWGSTGAGEATQVDVDFLTASGNDDLTVFCDATESYGDGDLGTPGSDNGQCEIPAPAGQCFDDSGSPRPIVTPSVGDLLITEFHANPDVVDDGDGEWFEVRANATVDLNGLEIRRAEDDDAEPLVAGDCISLQAGEYAVIAHEREPATNGGLPQVDGLFDDALLNSNGRLALETEGTILDAITWSSSEGGASMQLAPGLTDPEDNDDETNWCPSSAPYGDGDFGSPGTDNPACGGVSNGMCTDGGNERDIAAPSMGDLVITEVMPDPSAVGDSDGEWFEVKNTSGAAVDLNGLQMGFNDDNSAAELPGDGECITVDAGAYAVLAGNAEMATNGGLPADTIEMGFSSLGNSERTLWIGYGEAHWDELLYADPSAGVAWSVDPDAETTEANDIGQNICEAEAQYGDGDLGTPGAAGPTCPGAIREGQCLDGGTPRDIVSPAAGDVVITEWLANPSVVGDPQGEWFEVYFDAEADLNGLQLSRGGTDNWTVEDTLVDGDCLSVSAGTYVLFARNADTMTNGGLPAVDFEFTFSLNNGNNGLAIGLEDTFLDELDYASTTDGSATQLDAGVALAPASNDAIGNLCPATVPYGDGDNNGSPGAANAGC